MNTNNLEIERKFLVKEIPNNLNKYPYHTISQTYISTKPTIRLRKLDNTYIFTFKGKGTIKKTEFEYELSEKEYKNLLKKAETQTIKKTRYLIPLENNLTAELDIYEENLKGFMNIEVEFSSIEEAYAFNPPDWFGKDVSGDKRFSNASLSINGIPDIF